jgi:hypothetical protein
VFGFSLEDAESLRKCLAKKRIQEVGEWKDKIYNAAKERNLDVKVADYFWNAVEASANYSFNKCASPCSIVQTKEGKKTLKDVSIGDFVLAYDTKKKINHFVPVIDKMESKAELYEVETSSGQTIKCSMDHKFLTPEGMKTLREIVEKNMKVFTYSSF